MSRWLFGFVGSHVDEEAVLLRGVKMKQRPIFRSMSKDTLAIASCQRKNESDLNDAGNSMAATV
jgi:hypothetical protein